MGGQLPAITPRLVGRIALLALAYVAFGRLGLALDAVSGFATLVWAPTGIALAALLLGGTRLWPGVALGALIVNLWAGAPLAVACGIAVGNTLEAVLGTLALRRIRGFRASLDRIQDAIGFIVLAACLSPLASATIGVTSLLLGGVIEREAFGVTWGAWWVGDAIGALVVAPLMLSWASARRRKWPRERLLELGLMSVAVVAVALFIFRGVVRGEALAFLQPYLLAPVMLWAALRFDTRITTGAVFVISVVAVWGTAAGLGPFHGGDLVERLRSLQAFISLLAPTLLVLAAVAADRRRAEKALRVARDQAQAASHAKSRFLAIMSHELRTPLTGIMGYAELMQANIGGELSEKHREYVSRLIWSATYLVSLIEGVLTFSKAEAGRDEAHFEDVDLAMLLRDTVGIVEPLAAARGLSIDVELPDVPLHLVTDAGKVRQIVLNLLGNAVKFSSDGVIEIAVRRHDDFTSIRVTDHGVGIPADQVQRIFEPFTQLEEGGRAPSAGTGLGLSVSLTFARLLGGDIEVKSSPGRGSSFTLLLPDTPVPTAADGSTSSAVYRP